MVSDKESFPNQELKDVFEVIKKAVGNKPPTWSATYPQQEGGDLYVDVEDGVYEFTLPEVQYDANDIF